MYNVSFPKMGIELMVNPVALSIGNFNIYWYGIIIGTGFLLALLFAVKSLKRYGISNDAFFDCVLFGLIGGIVGARLYYVIFRWDTYSQDIMQIFAIHNGGLAIYGGIIGGLGTACIAAKIKKVNIPAMLDIGGMGFLIGQGLGRWGNFFNQEAFGTPTTLPWGMVSENTGGVAVHPCFLYESLWCLLGFAVLFVISLKWRKLDGQMFLMYLVWYGLERMVVEGLRTDSLYLPFMGLRVSQILSAVLVIVGTALLVAGFVRVKKHGVSLGVDRIAEQTEEETTADSNEKQEKRFEKKNGEDDELRHEKNFDEDLSKLNPTVYGPPEMMNPVKSQDDTTENTEKEQTVDTEE